MIEKHIAEVRAFNRFYTGIIGLLDQHVLNSDYSLPEVRVLYEMYHQPGITARDIMSSLKIDKGYLSRMLRQFEKKKLLARSQSGEDGRYMRLSLTALGKKEFSVLNAASDDQLKEILAGLTDSQCTKLVRNMASIKSLLSKT